jgi:hypothetical protein
MHTLVHHLSQIESKEAKFLALAEMSTIAKFDKPARALIFMNAQDGSQQQWKLVLFSCN